MTPLVLLVAAITIAQAAVLTPRRSFAWTTGLQFFGLGAAVALGILIPVELLGLMLLGCPDCPDTSYFPTPILEEAIRFLPLPLAMLLVPAFRSARLSDVIFWAIAAQVGGFFIEDTIRFMGADETHRASLATMGFGVFDVSRLVPRLWSFPAYGAFSPSLGASDLPEVYLVLSTVVPAIGLWLALRRERRALGMAVVVIGLAWGAFEHSLLNWFLATHLFFGDVQVWGQSEPWPAIVWRAIGQGRLLLWVSLAALVAAFIVDERFYSRVRGLGFGGALRDEARAIVASARERSPIGGFSLASSVRRGDAARSAGTRSIASTHLAPAPRAATGSLRIRGVAIWKAALAAAAIVLLLVTAFRGVLLPAISIPPIGFALLALGAVALAATLASAARRRDGLTLATVTMSFIGSALFLLLGTGFGQAALGVPSTTALGVTSAAAIDGVMRYLLGGTCAGSAASCAATLGSIGATSGTVAGTAAEARPLTPPAASGKGSPFLTDALKVAVRGDVLTAAKWQELKPRLASRLTAQQQLEIDRAILYRARTKQLQEQYTSERLAREAAERARRGVPLKIVNQLGPLTDPEIGTHTTVINLAAMNKQPSELPPGTRPFATAGNDPTTWHRHPDAPDAPPIDPRQWAREHAGGSVGTVIDAAEGYGERLTEARGEWDTRREAMLDRYRASAPGDFDPDRWAEAMYEQEYGYAGEGSADRFRDVIKAGGETAGDIVVDQGKGAAQDAAKETLVDRIRGFFSK